MNRTFQYGYNTKKHTKPRKSHHDRHLADYNDKKLDDNVDNTPHPTPQSGAHQTQPSSLDNDHIVSKKHIDPNCNLDDVKENTHTISPRHSTHQKTGNQLRTHSDLDDPYRNDHHTSVRSSSSNISPQSKDNLYITQPKKTEARRRNMSQLPHNTTNINQSIKIPPNQQEKYDIERDNLNNMLYSQISDPRFNTMDNGSMFKDTSDINTLNKHTDTINNISKNKSSSDHKFTTPVKNKKQSHIPQSSDKIQSLPLNQSTTELNNILSSSNVPSHKRSSLSSSRRKSKQAKMASKMAGVSPSPKKKEPNWLSLLPSFIYPFKKSPYVAKPPGSSSSSSSTPSSTSFSKDISPVAAASQQQNNQHQGIDNTLNQSYVSDLSSIDHVYPQVVSEPSYIEYPSDNQNNGQNHNNNRNKIQKYNQSDSLSPLNSNINNNTKVVPSSSSSSSSSMMINKPHLLQPRTLSAPPVILPRDLSYSFGNSNTPTARLAHFVLAHMQHQHTSLSELNNDMNNMREVLWRGGWLMHKQQQKLNIINNKVIKNEESIKNLHDNLIEQETRLRTEILLGKKDYMTHINNIRQASSQVRFDSGIDMSILLVISLIVSTTPFNIVNDTISSLSITLGHSILSNIMGINPYTLQWKVNENNILQQQQQQQQAMNNIMASSSSTSTTTTSGISPIVNAMPTTTSSSSPLTQHNTGSSTYIPIWSELVYDPIIPGSKTAYLLSNPGRIRTRRKNYIYLLLKIIEIIYISLVIRRKLEYYGIIKTPIYEYFSDILPWPLSLLLPESARSTQMEYIPDINKDELYNKIYNRVQEQYNRRQEIHDRNNNTTTTNNNTMIQNDNDGNNNLLRLSYNRKKNTNNIDDVSDNDNTSQVINTSRSNTNNIDGSNSNDDNPNNSYNKQPTIVTRNPMSDVLDTIGLKNTIPSWFISYFDRDVEIDNNITETLHGITPNIGTASTTDNSHNNNKNKMKNGNRSTYTKPRTQDEWLQHHFDEYVAEYTTQAIPSSSSSSDNNKKHQHQETGNSNNHHHSPIKADLVTLTPRIHNKRHSKINSPSPPATTTPTINHPNQQQLHVNQSPYTPPPGMNQDEWIDYLKKTGHPANYDDDNESYMDSTTHTNNDHGHHHNNGDDGDVLIPSAPSKEQVSAVPIAEPPVNSSLSTQLPPSSPSTSNTLDNTTRAIKKGLWSFIDTVSTGLTTLLTDTDENKEMKQ